MFCPPLGGVEPSFVSRPLLFSSTQSPVPTLLSLGTTERLLFLPPAERFVGLELPKVLG